MSLSDHNKDIFGEDFQNESSNPPCISIALNHPTSSDEIAPKLFVTLLQGYPDVPPKAAISALSAENRKASVEVLNSCIQEK